MNFQALTVLKSLLFSVLLARVSSQVFIQNQCNSTSQSVVDTLSSIATDYFDAVSTRLGDSSSTLFDDWFSQKASLDVDFYSHNLGDAFYETRTDILDDTSGVWPLYVDEMEDISVTAGRPYEFRNCFNEEGVGKGVNLYAYTDHIITKSPADVEKTIYIFDFILYESETEWICTQIQEGVDYPDIEL